MMAETLRSPRLYNLLSSQGRLHRFKKDESVGSTEGKSEIMVVVKGYIKRYRIANNGALGVQIVYGPQDVFSLTKVYDFLLGQNIYDGPETYYYMAMVDAQVFSLDATSFKEAAEKDPLLYRELFSEAGQHLKTCVHRIENVALVNAYSRVAHDLLYFIKKFGVQTPQGIELLLPLTHQDMADILGITRETVSKSIAKLRKEGVLSNDRRAKVLDIAALERIAYR